MNDTRLLPGRRIEPFTVETLSHGAVKVPGPGFTHLQFRRFAGCPICNLHVRSFARQQPRFEEAGIRTVAFFHSSAEAMLPFQGDLPFAVVPDPERRWYTQFGVERSVLAALHPAAMWAAMKGATSVKSNPMRGEGGANGLPADFLVAPDGALVAVKYGEHADDAWSVDDVCALARRSTGAALSPAAAASR
ncbi:MAG: peroxiredoxin-like family protein [Archangium sp.]